jgi:putative hydrolase of the HAD superfamily
VTPAAVGFDLDYTLWDQGYFPRSFFDAVAYPVARRVHRSPALVAAVFHAALERLTLHHPRLFGAALEDLGVQDPLLEAELVEQYHAHRPCLRPYPGTRELLAWLRKAGYRLFLVTDGHWETQRYKVEALGLAPCFEAMIFTDELAGNQQKPSPYPFLMAAVRLGLNPRQCVYVGDDPHRDFEGPRRIGIRTIGVSTGPFAKLPAQGNQAPDERIEALQDLRGLL